MKFSVSKLFPLVGEVQERLFMPKNVGLWSKPGLSGLYWANHRQNKLYVYMFSSLSGCVSVDAPGASKMSHHDRLLAPEASSFDLNGAPYKGSPLF